MKDGGKEGTGIFKCFYTAGEIISRSLLSRIFTPSPSARVEREAGARGRCSPKMRITAVDQSRQDRRDAMVASSPVYLTFPWVIDVGVCDVALNTPYRVYCFMNAARRASVPHPRMSRRTLINTRTRYSYSPQYPEYTLHVCEVPVGFGTLVTHRYPLITSPDFLYFVLSCHPTLAQPTHHTGAAEDRAREKRGARAHGAAGAGGCPTPSRGPPLRRLPGPALPLPRDGVLPGGIAG